MSNANDKTSGASTTARRSQHRVTIEDVATGAGVSVATVSRALRGLPNVAVSTRQRVADVAEELNYQPDPAAARLAAGTTKTVTVGVPSLNGWYFSTVVAGAEAVCNESGYEFQVIAIGTQADRNRLLDDDHHLERRTDGLLLVDVDPSPAQAMSLRRRGVALATIGNRLEGHPSVMIDDEHVGRMAAEHLLGLGHERLALIGGLDDDPMNFAVPRSRRRSFEQSITTQGLTLDESMIVSGNFSIDGGREAMASLLRRATPPTAVFAMSDEMAFGALMELDRQGLVVGVDVSVIGVDDHEFARVVKLTTIRQPVADHGAIAARMLIAAMIATATATTLATDPLTAGHDGAGRDRSARSDPADSVSHQPPLELVVRHTTGPVRPVR